MTRTIHHATSRPRNDPGSPQFGRWSRITFIVAAAAVWLSLPSQTQADPGHAVRRTAADTTGAISTGAISTGAISTGADTSVDGFPASAQPIQQSRSRAAARRPVLISNPPERESSSNSRATGAATTGTSAGVLRTVVVLCFVVGLILIVGTLWQRHSPVNAHGLPGDAIELIGRRHIDQRQMIQLVRCGSRILVLGSSDAGLRTLSEITDPVEVDLLAGACRQRQEQRVAVSPFAALFRNRQTRTSNDRERDDRDEIARHGTEPGRRRTPRTDGLRVFDKSHAFDTEFEDSHV